MKRNLSGSARMTLRAVLLPFGIWMLAFYLAAGCFAGGAPKEKRMIPGKPLRRADAFFGIHFDLHPSQEDTALGADITEEMIARFLDRVRPDYVQYDCKGVPGYLGYPSRVGPSAPGIAQDSLALWRKVTQERGVGLFIHYCGLWDSLEAARHPEWAVADAAGKPHPDLMSTFSPYVDRVLIPQIREAASRYDLEGVWLDADSWCAALDYSPAALEAWRRETGQPDAPKDRSDPRWQAWKRFHRRQYERYLAHWVDALHAAHPQLQLCSNWMYSTYSPKPVSAKVDYLSGDYTLTLSADRARVEARYLAHTKMPWDLIAWGFNQGKDLGSSLKPALHLEQEAATVIMQGGGFEIYYNPTRRGYVPEEMIEIAGQVARFCRERESVSFKSETVPQVALLLSAQTQFHRSDNLFAAWGCTDELEVALNALLESHYSVDILTEYQLQPRLKEFPLVVLADVDKLTDEFRQSLVQYVRNGGSLLLLGDRCARLFRDELGVEMVGEPLHTAAELASPAGSVNVNGMWQKVAPQKAEVAGYRYPSLDTRREGEVAATVAACGKGRVGAVYGPVALAYFRSHHPALRRLLADLAHRLFPHPAVTVEAPPCVDIALRRTHQGRLSLHLLNLAEAQRSDRFLSTDYIPPVGPIRATLQVPKRPHRVRWIPDGGRIKWAWDRGALSVTIPRLEVHGVLVIE